MSVPTSRPADPSGTRRAGARLGASLAVLVPLAVAVSDQTYLAGESGVLHALNDIPTWAGWPLRVVMELGTMLVALVVIGLVAWRTWERGPRPTVGVLIAATLAFRVDNVVKSTIDRPRPPAVVHDLHVRETIGGFGFPSGHTTMAFALAASLHPVVPARWRWAPWVLAAVVGFARMHVGVHWPADVVGGAALGTALGSASWLVVRAVPVRRGSVERVEAPL